MAIKKPLRPGGSEPEMASPHSFADGEVWDRTVAEDASGAAQSGSIIPGTSSKDACGTRSSVTATTVITEKCVTLPVESSGEPAKRAQEGGAPRWVTLRWSDLEELHFMLNALEKERKRLEEKLASMAEVLEENSQLRAAVELLKRERGSS